MSTAVPQVYLNSFNYRGYPFERALQQAAQFGYDGVELWAGHYQIDTVEQTLAAVQPLAQRLGIAVPVLNLSGNVIGDDAAERAARLHRLREIVRRVPDLGVRIINGYAGSIIVERHDWARNGSAAATEEHYARAVDAYRDLGAVAAHAGVVLTLEVHMNTIHDTAASAARLLDHIDMPAVRANFDPGNMYGTRSAEPALEAIAILGARIAYVHVKNARRVSYLLVGIDYHFDLAGGDLDYFQIVQALHQTGFRGPYGIEYSGAGDRSVASRRDVAYLRSLLAAVASEDVHAPVATTHQEPV